MEISIRYFAVVRERLGKKRDQLNVADGATSEEAMQLLIDKYPQLADIRSQIRIAVNETMLHEPVVLKAGDEIALIPPVAGG